MKQMACFCLSVLVFLLVFMKQSFAYVFSSTNVSGRRRVSPRYLIDPAVIDSPSQALADPLVIGTVNTAVSTFVTNLTSRLTGVLIGNILAGFAFTFIAKKFRPKVEQSKKKEITEVVPLPSKTEIPSDAWPKLAACLFVDFIGDSSFALPGIGELEDIAWAPLSSYALNVLFGSNFITGIDFIKEALPGTDIVPVATVAWILTYCFPTSPITGALGLKSSKKL